MLFLTWYKLIFLIDILLLFILARLLGVIPSYVAQHPLLSFELLGIKWLSSLDNQQARKISPFEKNTDKWKKHIRQLSTGMKYHHYRANIKKYISITFLDEPLISVKSINV